jgi:adenylate kinase
MTQKVLLCGTPGTGKSFICQHLLHDGRNTKVKVINVSDLVVTEKLYSEYDDDLSSAIIDEKRLRKRLKEIIEKSESDAKIVIECHSVGCIARKFVDSVVVLQASTDVLYDRLSARKYSKRKIEENMDCEIMQVVLEEATERFTDVTVECFTNDSEEDAKKVVEYINSL